MPWFSRNDKKGGSAMGRPFYVSERVLFFADVFIPDFRMLGDVAFEQLTAVLIIEVNDFNAIGAKPVEATGKSAAFTHNYCAEPELAHESTAIPAWGKRGDHNEVAITALTASAPKCIRFAVNAGIALLHAAVVTATDEFPGTRKDGCTDGDAAFGTAQARFVEGDFKHIFVYRTIHWQSSGSSMIVH
jgi:hypothetical protein